jgi:transposase
VGRIRRLFGDRAYDREPHDEKLAAQGIELITPHRKGRKKPATQDGRVLRRYKRRWKVERFFAWLNRFKRVISRRDHCADRYTGFVYLACAMILSRRYL